MSKGRQDVTYRQSGSLYTLCAGMALGLGMAICAGLGDARAQSSDSSVFPNPSGVTVRPASSSPFPDPNAATKSGNSASSVFPDPGKSTGGAPAATPFPNPGGAAGGFGAPPASPGGFGQPQGGPSQQVQQACAQQFNAMREERDNRGKAIQAAMKKKPGPDVACKLFRSFSAAEAKMLTFLKTQSSRCGIPPDLAKQLGKGHAQTEKTTNQICTAAAQPRGPAGPTMSDVLGGPVLPEATTERRSGGSTFDTINGNVLAR